VTSNGYTGGSVGDSLQASSDKSRAQSLTCHRAENLIVGRGPCSGGEATGDDALVSATRGVTWCIRFAGPVLRSGRNPMLCVFFRWEIANVRIGTITSGYRNEPASALIHFGMKRGFVGHAMPAVFSRSSVRPTIIADPSRASGLARSPQPSASKASEKRPLE
jgi:hypothetical protein